MEATLTSDGQITLPVEVSEHLHLSPGDRVKIFLGHDDRVVILPVLPITALRGIIPYQGRPVSVEEMDEGIAKAVAERDQQSR
jgi:antitoxin PrlF